MIFCACVYVYVYVLSLVQFLFVWKALFCSAINQCAIDHCCCCCCRNPTLLQHLFVFCPHRTRGFSHLRRSRGSVQQLICIVATMSSNDTKPPAAQSAELDAADTRENLNIFSGSAAFIAQRPEKADVEKLTQTNLVPEHLRRSGFGMSTDLAKDLKSSSAAASPGTDNYAMDETDFDAILEAVQSEKRARALRQTGGLENDDTVTLTKHVDVAGTQAINSNGTTIAAPTFKWVVVVRNHCKRDLIHPNTQNPVELIIGFTHTMAEANVVAQQYTDAGLIGAPEVIPTCQQSVFAVSEARSRNEELMTAKARRVRERFFDFWFHNVRKRSPDSFNNYDPERRAVVNAFSIGGEPWADYKMREELEKERREWRKLCQYYHKLGAGSPTLTKSQFPILHDQHSRLQRLTSSNPQPIQHSGGGSPGVDTETSTASESNPHGETAMDKDAFAARNSNDATFISSSTELAPADLLQSMDNATKVWKYPSDLRLPGQDIAVISLLRDTDHIESDYCRNVGPKDPEGAGKEPIIQYYTAFPESNAAQCTLWVKALQRKYPDMSFATVNMYRWGRVDHIDLSNVKTYSHHPAHQMMIDELSNRDHSTAGLLRALEDIKDKEGRMEPAM